MEISARGSDFHSPGGTAALSTAGRVRMGGGGRTSAVAPACQ